MAKVDLSEFEALSRPKKRACPIAKAIEELAKTEREQLIAALAVQNHEIGAGAIEAWLKRRGHVCNTQRVMSHRKGTCSCGCA